MRKEILLPEVAADFESGTIEAWLNNVGDKIEVGDILVEVSTDKAVVEVEAEDAGTLVEILVEAGTEDVAVNTPIAVLLLDGEASGAGNEEATGIEQKDAAVAADANESAPVHENPVDGSPDNDDRPFASPVATRIAQQLGLNLATISGSGPGGRIVLGDVESAAAQQGLDVQPATGIVSTTLELPPPGTYAEEPADKVRQVIARRLTDAKRDIPHFYLTVDCELDSLLESRRELNDSANAIDKVSINDFFVKACAMALSVTPDVNVAWSGKSILHFNDINIAVAVATPKGLMTPVVRQADAKNLAAISTELKELASRARAGRLQPDEYKGGGFTISNLGMYGVREFSAIINPPQSCILAVGAGELRPIVRENKVVVATMLSCTLSVDHRAVDGSLGAEFLQTLKNYIENPDQLLL